MLDRAVALANGRHVLGVAAGDAPGQPGVYLFLGEDDDLLYVGKATNLRQRLRQHAGVGEPTSHLHDRYSRVRRVVWEVAKTERAAAAGFFNAGPQLVRARRLRHGIKGRLLDADTYRGLVGREIAQSVGEFHTGVI